LSRRPARSPHHPSRGALRDSRGNGVARSVLLEGGRRWVVEDRLSGPFHSVAWHWRLCPGPWRLTRDGIAGQAATISAAADAPLRCELVGGWESLAYGAIAPAPVLLVTASAPVGRVTTTIDLP
jgi:hypothetical protein